MADRIINDIDSYITMVVEENHDPLALAFVSCQAFQEYVADIALRTSSGAEIGSTITQALRISSSLFRAYWILKYGKGEDHDKNTIKESAV